MESLNSKKFDVLTSRQLDEVAGGLFGISRWKSTTFDLSGQEGEYHTTTVYTTTGWGNFWGADDKGEEYD